jgi:pilus assembly protein CpaB
MAAKRYSLVFYAALVVALLATYGVYRIIESTKAGNRIATGTVVVASRDIPEGEIIDRIAISTAEWPLQAIPAGAFSRIDSVAGRVSKVRIFQGEPFVPGRLAPVGTTAGLTTKITPGKRAMAVRINDVSGIAGMIQPDSRVDILLTLNGGSSGGQTKTFMSNMRILAMGSQVQENADGRSINTTVATLEVTPEEGEKLVLAQSQGQIQLMLRGYGDPEEVVTKGATISDVNALLRDRPVVQTPQRNTRSAPQTKAPDVAPVQSAPVVPPPAPRTAAKPESLTVEIYRGAKRSDEKFKKDSIRRDTIPR